MRKIFLFSLIFIVVSVGVFGFAFITRYQVKPEMLIAVEEVTTAEYPEDPSDRSTHYDQYGGRVLRLLQRDETHFDFIFESKDPSVAKVIFKNIDLSLFVPIEPQRIKGNSNLEIITFAEREWNRQQVSFKPGSEHLEISGGDGFEKNHLSSAELARNCLNAGLWEVMLYTQEDGKKALFYQGWFTFPMGHYKRIFETYNGISYWRHWYRLEHWFDPEGTTIDLTELRQVISEKEVPVAKNPVERIIVSGEQKRKGRTLNAKNVRCWGDFCENEVSFATFVPPGRYQVGKPWGNEYERIAIFEKATLRKVQIQNDTYDEVELEFRSSDDDEPHRFIVSGIDINSLPQLPVERYHKGLYMPMGISVPPFYQSYEDLKAEPPYNSPYFCVLINGKDEWINHHDVAIDGPVMHRDLFNPNLVHLYILSYERQSLVGHFILSLTDQNLPRRI